MGICSRTRFLTCVAGLTLLAAGWVLFYHSPVSAQKEGPKEGDKGPAKEVKKKEIGKNVFLETEGETRRVLINAAVCRRTDLLEQFMCRTMTKEHEAIVAADADARHIHAALLVAGAEPGSPAKFDEKGKFYPARGTKIKVYVEYEEKGKKVKVPAQQWVKNMKSTK